MQSKQVTGNKAALWIFQSCADEVLNMGRQLADIADGAAAGALVGAVALANRFAFVGPAVYRCFGRLYKHNAT
jgi:hypothetical protein